VLVLVALSVNFDYKVCKISILLHRDKSWIAVNKYCFALVTLIYCLLFIDIGFIQKKKNNNNNNNNLTVA